MPALVSAEAVAESVSSPSSSSDDGKSPTRTSRRASQSAAAAAAPAAASRRSSRAAANKKRSRSRKRREVEEEEDDDDAADEDFDADAAAEAVELDDYSSGDDRRGSRGRKAARDDDAEEESLSPTAAAAAGNRSKGGSYRFQPQPQWEPPNSMPVVYSKSTLSSNGAGSRFSAGAFAGGQLLPPTPLPGSALASYQQHMLAFTQAAYTPGAPIPATIRNARRIGADRRRRAKLKEALNSLREIIMRHGQCTRTPLT